MCREGSLKSYHKYFPRVQEDGRKEYRKETSMRYKKEPPANLEMKTTVSKMKKKMQHICCKQIKCCRGKYSELKRHKIRTLYSSDSVDRLHGKI